MKKVVESLLDEIRRVRKELDEEMKRDPGVIHRLARSVQKKYKIKSISSPGQLRKKAI